MELKKEAFVQAWCKTFGNISETCKAVKISRQTYYRWMEEDAEFVKVINEVEPEELLMDFVESNLMKKIRKGDTACLIFVAKTKAKKRGYVERQEHSGPDGEPLPTPQATVNFTIDYSKVPTDALKALHAARIKINN